MALAVSFRCRRHRASPWPRTSSASFSSSLSSRCCRSPTCRTRAPGAPDLERPAQAPRRALCSTTSAAPTYYHAQLSADRRPRPSARRRAVASAPRSVPPRARRTRSWCRARIAFRGAETRPSSSLSFHRSVPSTIRKRRPIANVIALNAAATESGSLCSPSNSSMPFAPLSCSAIALCVQQVLGDPAVVIAVDQIGGLERRHRASLGPSADVPDPSLITDHRLAGKLPNEVGADQRGWCQAGVVGSRRLGKRSLASPNCCSSARGYTWGARRRSGRRQRECRPPERRCRAGQDSAARSGHGPGRGCRHAGPRRQRSRARARDGIRDHPAAVRAVTCAASARRSSIPPWAERRDWRGPLSV